MLACGLLCQLPITHCTTDLMLGPREKKNFSTEAEPYRRPYTLIPAYMSSCGSWLSRDRDAGSRNDPAGQHVAGYSFPI